MAEICHTKVVQVTLRDVSNGMLGNKRSSFSNRLIPILPKSENDVRIWAKLERTNPTGKPVGSVRIKNTYRVFNGEIMSLHSFIVRKQTEHLKNNNYMSYAFSNEFIGKATKEYLALPLGKLGKRC